MRADTTKQPIGFQYPPEVRELSQEESPISLLTDMLKHIICMDFIEGVVPKRQGNL